MAHKRIRKLFVRRRPCQFCLNRNSANNYIDYKDESVLIKLVNLQGKILSSRITGTCAKHQRAVSLAIKRARYVGILPYVGPLPKRFDELRAAAIAAKKESRKAYFEKNEADQTVPRKEHEVKVSKESTEEKPVKRVTKKTVEKE